MAKKRTVSIAALEKALNASRQRVEKLREMRQALLDKIAKVDAEIAALAGEPIDATAEGAAEEAPGKPKAKGGKRPKNKMTMKEAIVHVLTESGEAMGVKEIAQGVLAAGYKTKSKDLPAQIWSTIYTDKTIGRPARGKFQITAKKEEATEEAEPKSEPKPKPKAKRRAKAKSK